MPDDMESSQPRRTNSDIYALIEEVRGEARLNNERAVGAVKAVATKIDNHLTFHEGVLIAAKELGERRIKFYSLAIGLAALLISAVALLIGQLS